MSAETIMGWNWLVAAGTGAPEGEPLGGFMPLGGLLGILGLVALVFLLACLIYALRWVIVLLARRSSRGRSTTEGSEQTDG